ncbi:MAG TPA: hypothetical protein PLO31_03820 [Dysgonamonadaceae bacterium]|jgi:hypothetical protein|nr:hypothetical protein [Dysgonamonadaceae bacterium]
MSLPHVERDPEVEPERTLCDGGASLMQAWSEDGTALVRGRGILSRNTFTENVNKNPDDTHYKNKKGDHPGPPFLYEILSLYYPKNEINTPAAIADPITPETLLAIQYCRI